MSGLIRAAARSQRERGAVMHALLFVGVSALAGVLVAGLVIPIVGMLGMSARGVTDSFVGMNGSLPEVELAQRSNMYSADGEKLATFWDENRISVSLDKVAPVMRDAVIAIEDARFYDHGPLDVRGTLRAFARNSQSSSGASQGGSTITQQYVKQVLVQANKYDRKKKQKVLEESYGRKLQELRYAVELEKDTPKDDILAGYLNIVYFGDGAWGIESAAKHFFGVRASELKVQQAAMLAGLVRDPNALDPVRNAKRVLQRRNLVLSRMADTDKISRGEADAAMKKPLGVKIHNSKNGCIYSKWPQFCDYAVQWLLSDKALGKDETERRRAVLGGGLRINTTITAKAQKAALDAVKSTVHARDKAYGALTMVQPGTGNVLAMAQSRPYGGNTKKHQTYLNYTVGASDHGGLGVQPGSTFKPFVLAAAIEQGIPLTHRFPSPDRVSYPKRMTTCGKKPWKSWGRHITVGNSSRAGAPRIDAFRATQRSVNTYYLNLEKATGLCRPYRIATAAGVKRGDGKKLLQVPSFVFGVNEVTPLSMSEAYATFAARGLHCAATPVAEVYDRFKERVAIRGAGCKQVIDQQTADGVNFVLNQVVDGSRSKDPSRTGKDMMIPGRQVAGKTGTNEFRKYVSFAGYTPNLAAYAVIGGEYKDRVRPLLDVGRIGGRYVSTDSVWGGKLAGPMWEKAMTGALKGEPFMTFNDEAFKDIRPMPLEIPQKKKKFGKVDRHHARR